jgi:hypothetical protein
MALPKVFAVYRTSTETFLLIQPELNDNGTVARLKPWFAPNIKDIPAMPQEMREKHSSWLNGNEWYVEPCEFGDDTQKLQTVAIPPKDYHWCYTGYRLVWSNYAVHSRRNTLGAQVWNSSPTIPILEFSSRHIFPRMYSPFYPRWVTVKPSELAESCMQARELFIKNEDALVYKNLRIRTPRPEDDEDTDDEDGPYSSGCRPRRRASSIEDDLSESAGTHFLPVLLLFILLGCVVGLYGLIGHISFAV